MGLLRALRGSGGPARDTVDVVLHDRPRSDLRGYAADRGLEFRDQVSQIGYRVAFPMSEDRQFNVLRGELPGGEYGVLVHTITRTAERTHAPFTTVAISVPEAIGSFLRFQLVRLGPRAKDEYNERDDELAPDGWKLTRAKAADRPALAAALDPVAVEGLSALEGFPEVNFSYGSLRVRCDGFLDRPDELDALANTASALAASMRAAGGRSNGSFAAALEQPSWLDEPYATKKLFGKEIHRGSEAQTMLQSPDSAGLEAPLHGRWRELLPGLVDSTGLTAEDALAYHRALPLVPVPGQAFAVLHGTLPHGGEGRAVLYSDKDIDTNVGLTAILLPAAPGAQDIPARPGERVEPGGRLAARGGIVAGWRGWPTTELDVTDEIARLAEDVSEAARAHVLIAG